MIPLKDTIPSRKTPYMTFALIISCTLIFLYQFLISDASYAEIIYKYGFIPARIKDIADLPNSSVEGGAFTFISSQFLHGGWFHLISNMWFLWIFGDNVEDMMGPFKFILFYFLCGISANIAHMIFNSSSVIPAVGASGAIAGVMGAYFRLFPESRIKTFIPLFILLPFFVYIPATIYILVWFITQVYSGAIHSIAGGGSVGGVAWWAHVGGFIGGLALHRLFIRRPPRTRYYML